MISNYISCCHECRYREVGCHSWCEVYKTKRAELDAINEKEFKQKLVKSSLDSQLYDAQTKTYKRKRKFR